MPHSKLAIIHRLRLQIEAEQNQLNELVSETLEEVLTTGPIEDPEFECHAERTFEEGKIVFHLQVYKRRRPAATTADHDLVEIQHRLAMFCYALMSCAALNFG